MAVYAMVQNNTNDGEKFTLEKIKAAHAKTKSGADFPNYIQEIKEMGVIAYEHFLSDGHIKYHGENEYTIAAPPKWETKKINTDSDKEDLKAILKIHQSGKTDYLTFCAEAAEIGVEKWIVDMKEMTCTYYDLQGNKMLTEKIPANKA
ncbi:MAG: DUF1398 family protein [Bacteroidota bacterium]